MISKVFGALFVLLGAAIMASEISAQTKDALREYQGFLSLLRHIKTKIDCFMTPIEDIMNDFRCDALEKSGLLDAIKSDGMYIALLNFKTSLKIKREAVELLTTFAKRLGDGQKQEEVGFCDYYIEKLEAIYDTEKDALPKNCKLKCTLILCAALMLVIIMI